MRSNLKHYGIHWFRRDLRIAGNPALKWNWKQFQGRTLGVFFFDSKFLSRPDFSHSRFGFFLQTLKALKVEMAEAGGDLLVLDKGPDEGFDWLLSRLGSCAPSAISFNRDYEPFARQRDSRLLQWIEGRGIPVHTERDHLILEPNEVRKEDSPGSFYQIYTPFSKKWASIFLQDEIQERVKLHKETLTYLQKKAKGEAIEPFLKIKWNEVLQKPDLQDQLDDFISKNQPHLKVPLPGAGSVAAFNLAHTFSKKVSKYLEDRDFPNLNGTSKLSPYFKNGSITPALVIGLLGLNRTQISTPGGASQFLKELIWREFYYHILYHRPDVEHQSFLPQFRHLKWENHEKWFEAWKEGKTGFPIVDAGMRELKVTGGMHNRVRMIVASFLTKDLLIDWRWGEKHFMNLLIDGDLAPNNGGWQWAASTGCDPQPYFRIFNPKLQSEKFDPKGDYIKKYVPELKYCSPKEIHSHPSGYIKPIVDHATQKAKALSLYKDRTGA